METGSHPPISLQAWLAIAYNVFVAFAWAHWAWIKIATSVSVTVTPEVVRPRQTVTATIETDEPIDEVATATLEWGYDNFYRYHWAGKVDSVAAAENDSWLTMDQVGTNYGGERVTDDWVCVTRVELPVATSEFTGASSEAAFTRS